MWLHEWLRFFSVWWIGTIIFNHLMSAEPISELFYSILHKRISSVYTSIFATRMHSSRMRTARSSSRQLGGVCLSACWDTPPRCGPGDSPGCGPGDSPQVWAWRTPPGGDLETPPGVGLETPLGVGLETPLETPWRPLQLPLGCGLENLQGMLGYTPWETCKACWDTTCKACWDTTPPPPPVDIQARVKT